LRLQDLNNLLKNSLDGNKQARETGQQKPTHYVGFCYTHNMNFLTEIYYFLLKNISAGVFCLSIILAVIVTSFFEVTDVARYDLLFIYVLMVQMSLLLTGLETKQEFLSIVVFHILATIMELFKTHPSIGSWVYPGWENTIFTISTVPLFVGFMYSAVGSYIVRSHKVMQFRYVSYPQKITTVLLAIGIYLNFFTHHYIHDMRYVLLLATCLIFWKTKIRLQIYKKNRTFSFVGVGLIVTTLIWFAENIATYYKVWLYPNQVEVWQMVSYGKYSSWFLLLVMSFVIVKTLHLGNNAHNE